MLWINSWCYRFPIRFEGCLRWGYCIGITPISCPFGHKDKQKFGMCARKGEEKWGKGIEILNNSTFGNSLYEDKSIALLQTRVFSREKLEEATKGRARAKKLCVDGYFLTSLQTDKIISSHTRELTGIVFCGLQKVDPKIIYVFADWAVAPQGAMAVRTMSRESSSFSRQWPRWHQEARQCPTLSQCF